MEFENALLARLQSSDCGLLTSALEPIHLQHRQVVQSPGRPVAEVYFPRRAVVSVVARAPRDRRMEVGVIGYEGMTGIGVMLGDPLALSEMIVHTPGTAYRIRTAALVKAAAASRTLHGLLLRYVHTFIAQMAQTALAGGRATLEERLARWLLMSQDRFRENDIVVTHDFLAQMLGVRRAGVTVALRSLASRKRIRSGRRCITIVDRQGLIDDSNGSYGVAETVYRRLCAVVDGA